jgi:hypothetical protein
MIALAFAIRDIHALTLTKDTVYETAYLGWNDSTSLLNKSSDSVRITAISFSVPPGKYAELRLGFGSPYVKFGNIGGPVIHSEGIQFDSFGQTEIIIPPGGRIPITGFQISYCIECPAAQNRNARDEMDTVAAYLIFDTKIKKDTLVAIGDIQMTANAILKPLRSRKPNRDGMESWLFWPFNILGQLRHSNKPDPDPNLH